MASTVPVAVLVVALTGCGSKPAATGPAVSPPRPASPSTVEPSSETSVEIMTPEEEAEIPNPGSGSADPRLATALLTRFQAERSAAMASIPGLPGAAVRFPVRDIGSTFISRRQVSSPFDAAATCTKWTAGMWAALIDDFNTAGVQLAVGMLEPPPPEADDLFTERRRRGTLTFSQAIISAPPRVLDTLADGRVPGDCARLTSNDGAAGRIEPLPASRVGDRSWAYRIIDTSGHTWQWVQVIRFRDHLIEIRIPNQEPGPHGDMTDILGQIAAQAHTKAAQTLT